MDPVQQIIHDYEDAQAQLQDGAYVPITKELNPYLGLCSRKEVRLTPKGIVVHGLNNFEPRSVEETIETAVDINPEDEQTILKCFRQSLPE